VVLGIVAAVISASVVLERIAATSEARNHQAGTSNLPRAEARKALDEARANLKAAEVAVTAEIKNGGCKAVRQGLKKDAEAARSRVDKARAELVALGATSAETRQHPCSVLTR
jgi:ribonuclease I